MTICPSTVDVIHFFFFRPQIHLITKTNHMDLQFTFPEPQPAVKNAILKTIFRRRAVRNYLDKPVDRETIDQLVEAGRMAPSAINLQPYRFIILDDAVQIKKFAEQIGKVAEPFFRLAHGVTLPHSGDTIFYHAPVVVFLVGPKNDDWAGLDIGMCAQNMMLAAKSLGLDTCPVGLAKLAEQTAAYPELGIASGEKIYIALTIGYGADTPAFHGRKNNNAVYLRK